MDTHRNIIRAWTIQISLSDRTNRNRNRNENENEQRYNDAFWSTPMTISYKFAPPCDFDFTTVAIFGRILCLCAQPVIDFDMSTCSMCVIDKIRTSWYRSQLVCAGSTQNIGLFYLIVFLLCDYTSNKKKKILGLDPLLLGGVTL